MQIWTMLGLATASTTPEGVHLELCSDREDRALLGLSACPCPESTDALIRLYREAAEPSVRAQITRVLLDRVPAEA
ncbi:MAG: hypothetical protein AAF602_00600, partial [Myxococcota bacterium]